MPSESQPTQNTTAPTNGPDLLEERSIGGIFVHFLAIPTGVVGAGLVYLAATNEFTRQNARNALDWHLTILALTVVTFGSVITYAELTEAGVDGFAVLPGPAASVVGLLIFALVAIWMVASAWTFIVGLLAMGKAIYGTAWRYPLTPALVERYGPRIDMPGGWPIAIVGYALFAPLGIGLVFLNLEGSAAFIVTWLAITGLIAVLMPVAVIAMYKHGTQRQSEGTAWQPYLLAYLGIPSGVAVGGYVLSDTLTDSINPAGDALYVFLAAFWVSALVYLVRWRNASA